MKWTPGYMEVRFGGRRYWGTLLRHMGGYIWLFWSDHKWPFYHGHFTQQHLDRKEAMEAFTTWLPGQ